LDYLKIFWIPWIFWYGNEKIYDWIFMLLSAASKVHWHTEAYSNSTLITLGLHFSLEFHALTGIHSIFLQCFDTVGWMTGNASELLKKISQLQSQSSLGGLWTAGLTRRDFRKRRRVKRNPRVMMVIFQLKSVVRVCSGCYYSVKGFKSLFFLVLNIKPLAHCPFYRATLCVSAVFAVGRCLSLSATLVYCIQTAKDIVKFFLSLAAPSL